MAVLVHGLALGGCAPGTAPAADSARPRAVEPEAGAQPQVAAAAGAEGGVAAEEQAEPSARAAAQQCSQQPIYRDRALLDGLPATSDDCRKALRRLVELDGAGDACRSDADCTIHPAAGGCMGIGISTTAAPGATPLDRSCAPSLSCWEADFTDHHVRCEAGCCLPYET